MRPGQASRSRRLYRNPRNKVVAGVCGGLGRYFGIDPVIFRIGFAALTMAGGSGILLYVVFWVVVPEWGDDSSMGERLVRHGPHRSTLGVILLALAGIVVLHSVFWHGTATALTLMAAGIALLVWKRGDGPVDRTGRNDRTEDLDDFGAFHDLGRLEDDDEDDEDEVDEVDEVAYSTGYVRYQTSPAGPRQPRPRSYLGRLTMATILLVSGVLALGAATGAIDVGLDTALAIALLITGLGLLVGAWVGRSRGLILVGIMLTLLLAAAAFVDVPLRGGVGERRFAPADLAEVRDEYRMIVGEMRLDLSDVDFSRRRTEIEATMAAGEMRIVVPRGIDVEVDASVQAGETNILGTTDEGLDLAGTTVDDVDGRPGTLVLHLEVGAGRVEVARAAA